MNQARYCATRSGRVRHGAWGVVGMALCAGVMLGVAGPLAAGEVEPPALDSTPSLTLPEDYGKQPLRVAKAKRKDVARAPATETPAVATPATRVSASHASMTRAPAQDAVEELEATAAALLRPVAASAEDRAPVSHAMRMPSNASSASPASRSRAGAHGSFWGDTAKASAASVRAEAQPATIVTPASSKRGSPGQGGVEGEVIVAVRGRTDDGAERAERHARRAPDRAVSTIEVPPLDGESQPTPLPRPVSTAASAPAMPTGAFAVTRHPHVVRRAVATPPVAPARAADRRVEALNLELPEVPVIAPTERAADGATVPTESALTADAVKDLMISSADVADARGRKRAESDEIAEAALRRVRGRLGVSQALAARLAARARAGDESNPGAKARTLLPLDGLPAVEEGDVAAMIASIRDREGERATGAAEVLREKRLLPLSGGEAFCMTMRRGLSIKFSDLGLDRAEANEYATRDAFLPTFQLSYGFSRSQNFFRREKVVYRRYDDTRLANQFGLLEDQFRDLAPGGDGGAFDDGGADADAGDPTDDDTVNTVFGAIYIDGILATPGGVFPAPFVNGEDWVTASDTSDWWTNTFSAGFRQEIPWGSALEVFLTAAHQKQHVDNLETNTLQTSTLVSQYQRRGSNPYTISYTDANATWEVYKQPWFTIWSGQLTVPLPGTKDFGPYGPNHAERKVAARQRRAAYWAVQQTINNSLQNASLAYLDLILAAKRLETVRAGRQTMELLLSNTEKLVEAKRATAYALLQVQTELERRYDLEERALATYLIASNRLRRLMDLEEDVVFLPNQFADFLTPSETISLDEALEMALTVNPALQQARRTVEAQEILHAYRVNQARPDLKFLAYASYSQDRSKWGYKTLRGALADSIKGDQEYHYLGMELNLPWGYNAARARVRQAEHTLERTKDEMEQVRLAVERRVKDAFTTLASLQGTVKAAAARKRLAQQAYLNASKLKSAGRLTDFELIDKNTDLIVAELAWIEALVQRKAAEINLLAAQGVLQRKVLDRCEVTDVTPGAVETETDAEAEAEAAGETGDADDADSSTTTPVDDATDDDEADPATEVGEGAQALPPAINATPAEMVAVPAEDDLARPAPAAPVLDTARSVRDHPTEGGMPLTVRESATGVRFLPAALTKTTAVREAVYAPGAPSAPIAKATKAAQPAASAPARPEWEDEGWRSSWSRAPLIQAPSKGETE